MPKLKLRDFIPGNKENLQYNITQICAVHFNEFIKVENFSSNLDHLRKENNIELKKIINKYSTIFAKDKL